MQVEAKWCMDEPWMNQIHKPHYDLGLENNYIVYQVIGDECCIKMKKKFGI
jgi:hypothetical protein